ncbi:hypothetical protein GQ53DRAFT_754761 [Thozetella sp. PMI_491]|nr:hypothetical protein GQ53DRAFT_754761 [Thozetella sp. PMI_491]
MAQISLSTCSFNLPVWGGAALPIVTFNPLAWNLGLSIEGTFLDSAQASCLASIGSSVEISPYLVDAHLNVVQCTPTTLIDGKAKLSCPSVKFGTYTLNFNAHEALSVTPTQFDVRPPGFTVPSPEVTPAPRRRDLRRRAVATSTDDGCDIPTTTSSTPPATPTATNPACPANDGYQYITSGQSTWNVTCYQDYQQGQIAVAQSVNFAGCIETCANTTGCVAASYTGGSGAGFCYLKNQKATWVTASNVWAAVLL